MSANYLDNKLNAILCLAFGWPANFLLIWLILYRTSKSLKVWSQVLLQSALIDLILLAIAFIVQPVIVSDGKVVYFFSNGPLADFFGQFKQASYFVFAFWLEFAKLAVAVQCFYRWLLICMEKELSKAHYALLLLLPMAVAFAEISIVIWELSIEGQGAPECSECPSGQQSFFIMRQDTNNSLIVDLFWSACNLCTFSVILLTNLLIWLKTRRSLIPQQQHSQEINRQVGLVLLIQALLPLVLSMLPTLLIVVYNASGQKIPGWLSILFTQTWTSFAYPLLALLIIGQYRRNVFSLICCAKMQVQPSNQPKLQNVNGWTDFTLGNIEQGHVGVGSRMPRTD